jgi:MFS family permease
VSGRWSDRIGRKPLIGVGYGMAAVGKVFVAMATVWPVVLVGRIVDRLGKGTRGAPRDALLADGVPGHDLGRVFGFHRAMDTAGAVVGPLLGLAVLAMAGGNLRVALWVAVVPAVVSVLLVAFVVDRPKASATTAADATAAMAAPRPAPAEPQAPPAQGPMPAGFRVVVTLLAVVALANLPDALVLLRVNQLGYSSSGVVFVYVLYNLVYALVSYPAGAVTARWSRARVYALGLACFAVGVGGLGLVHGGPVVALLMVVYGGFNGCTDGVAKAWVSGLVPAAVRGHAQGVFQGLTGGAVLVAGLWGGLAWGLGAGKGSVPLVIAGSVAAVAAVVMAVAGRRLG